MLLTDERQMRILGNLLFCGVGPNSRGGSPSVLKTGHSTLLKATRAYEAIVDLVFDTEEQIR